jgi:hypothetical protein
MIARPDHRLSLARETLPDVIAWAAYFAGRNKLLFKILDRFAASPVLGG